MDTGRAVSRSQEEIQEGYLVQIVSRPHDNWTAELPIGRILPVSLIEYYSGGGCVGWCVKFQLSLHPNTMHYIPANCVEIVYKI